MKLSGPAINTTNLELVNLATIKAYTSQSSNENDAILQVLLNNTHRSIYTLLGDRMIKRVAGTPWVYVIDGGSDALQLPQWPVITSTLSLEFGYIEDSLNNWMTLQLFDSVDYYVNDEWGMVYLVNGGCWPLGYRNIKAQFEAGVSTCPDDLADAICQWVGVKFQRYSLKRWDTATVTREMETMTYRESEIPKEARMILRRYEREASGIV